MARKDTRIHLARISPTAAMLALALDYHTATTETVCGKCRTIAQCAQSVADAREKHAQGVLCGACISAYKIGVQFGAPALIWPDECKGK